MCHTSHQAPSHGCCLLPRDINSVVHHQHRLKHDLLIITTRSRGSMNFHPFYKYSTNNLVYYTFILHLFDDKYWQIMRLQTTRQTVSPATWRIIDCCPQYWSTARVTLHAQIPRDREIFAAVNMASFKIFLVVHMVIVFSFNVFYS